MKLLMNKKCLFCFPPLSVSDLNDTKLWSSSKSKDFQFLITFKRVQALQFQPCVSDILKRWTWFESSTLGSSKYSILPPDASQNTINFKRSQKWQKWIVIYMSFIKVQSKSLVHSVVICGEREKRPEGKYHRKCGSWP